MPLRKSREQRDAERAEVDRQDREHAARLAALNDVTRQGPIFCQSCRAKLRPDAVRCHYCGGTDLARNDPSAPLFSQAAVGGACGKCGGRAFTRQATGLAQAQESASLWPALSVPWWAPQCRWARTSMCSALRARHDTGAAEASATGPAYRSARYSRVWPLARLALDHVCSPLGLCLHETLVSEPPDSFPGRRSSNLELGHQLCLGRYPVTRLIDAGTDPVPDDLA